MLTVYRPHLRSVVFHLQNTQFLFFNAVSGRMWRVSADAIEVTRYKHRCLIQPRTLAPTVPLQQGIKRNRPHPIFSILLHSRNLCYLNPGLLSNSVTGWVLSGRNDSFLDIQTVQMVRKITGSFVQEFDWNEGFIEHLGFQRNYFSHSLLLQSSRSLLFHWTRKRLRVDSGYGYTLKKLPLFLYGTGRWKQGSRN